MYEVLCFFFKQKTAYEMRISDWSSDVCSFRSTLFLAISQSGETADTLAALREAKKLGYVGTCAICNVAESSVVREADLALMTRAEIGRASCRERVCQYV